MSPRIPAGHAVAVFEELDSTNEEARRRAVAGERGPIWIWTKRQTSGRGRRGRPWESPPGNLMTTLLMAPGLCAAEAAGLSFVAALAVHDFISERAPRSPVKLKWPNDVLLEGRKVAGILLESSGEERDGILPWLAVGIGVNLLHSPREAQFPATALALHVPAPSPGEALAELAEAWESRFRAFRVYGFAQVREAWLERAAGVGGPVEVRLPGETLSGVFETLMGDGALSLLLPGGGRRAISAGEVYFAP